VDGHDAVQLAWYSRVDTIAISEVARTRPSSLRTSGLDDHVETVLRKDTASFPACGSKGPWQGACGGMACIRFHQKNRLQTRRSAL
jgi:hypothetical protein